MEEKYKRPGRIERARRRLETTRGGLVGPRRNRRFHERLEADPWGYMDVMFRGGFRAMNVGANAVGLLIAVAYFIFLDDVLALTDITKFAFLPLVVFAVVSITAATLSQRWVDDLAGLSRARREDQVPPDDLLKRAQGKIMDYPVFAAAVSLSAWFTSAAAVSAFFFFQLRGDLAGSEVFIPCLKSFVGIMVAGVFTAAIILFISEVICQSLRPYFFRGGESAHGLGRFKLGLRRRLFISFVMTSLLPLMLLAVLSFGKVRLLLAADPAAGLQSLLNLTIFIVLSASGMSFIINHLLEHSILDPVEDLERAMTRVEAGDFSTRITVTSNDEIGALADRFNAMTAALKDGARMRNSLALAREVQQSLLPGGSPRWAGLDVSGRSLYCDETGGDYYDFVEDRTQGRLSLVVADVSEHGVSSALLMASTRALIREYLLLTPDPATAVGAVNRVLVRDVGESGRFVTMCLAQLDVAAGKLSWASAGHDPPLLYDPGSDEFHLLEGRGPALGLLDGFAYPSGERMLEPGQVLILATDGVWEARNEQGEMFGKERLGNIVRGRFDRPAGEIVDAVLEAVIGHCGGRGLEDDVTLAAAKVTDDRMML
ncbi:MAG: SpoIIE family protein phosphatase [Pseudomonadota bacterium]